MDALCSIKSHIASFYDVVHLWTFDWVLFLDIHMQILYLQILTSFVVSFEFSYVGYYQSSDTLTIHNCFRQKSDHLSLTHIFFTFNTAVVMAVWAGQIFKC